MSGLLVGQELGQGVTDSGGRTELVEIYCVPWFTPRRQVREGLWAQWSGNSAGLRLQTGVAPGPKKYSMCRGRGGRFPSPLKNIYLYISLCQILVAACEIFSMWDLVPWPGIEPGASALGVWSLSHCHQGSPPSPFQGMQCDWHLEDPRDTVLLGTSGAGSLQGAGRQ